MSREIQIEGATIRLGQLLKLAGIVDSGSAVKALLAAQPVSVNGEPETRRGRQLHPGDSVSAGEHQLLLVAADQQARGSRSEPQEAERR
ncbi:MAG TPA: RNA-binding S4 domain-containing protein [Solirubrobacteraceae bacterium]|jgi:ribosome-associated protein|nr:RNA-binding S4 domain-containing protein [Solirubrobacteraceae bacterium]